MSSYPERLRDSRGNVPPLRRHDPGELSLPARDRWRGIPGWTSLSNRDFKTCKGCKYIKCSCPPQADSVTAVAELPNKGEPRRFACGALVDLEPKP